MNSKAAKKYTTLFGWAIVVFVAIMFVRTLRSNWSNLDGISLKPDILVLFSFACTVAAVVVSGVAWGRIVTKLSNKGVRTKDAVRIHLASWLLKYVPGQAGSLLNKLAWAKQEGLDGKKITASFIYENTFVLLASVVVSAPVLLVALGGKFIEGMNLFIPLLVTLPLVAIILTPKFFAFLLNAMFKVMKKKSLSHEDLLAARNIPHTLAEFLIPRMLNGLSFVLLAVSVFNIPSSQYAVFGAIYVLAGIVGILAIFVPSGLGVREAVITLFATAYIPVGQAVALALIARFYATLADIIIFLLYLYLSPRKGVSK